jgi:tetratricopeptide (TPR) repeat protein
MKPDKHIYITGVVVILSAVFYTQIIMWRVYLAHKSYDAASYEEPLKQLERAVRLSGGNSSFYFRIGEILQGEQKYQPAEKQYLKAISLEPTNASYHLRLANIYIATGRSQQAETELKKAIKLNPADYQAHYRLAHYYAFRAGMPILDEAYGEYKTALFLADDKQRFYILDEIYPNIAQDVAELIKFIPKGAQAMYDLAVFLKDKKRYKEAWGVFMETIVLARQEGALQMEVNAYNWLGVIQLRQGRFDEAVSILERARTIMPENGWTLRNLGWAYLQKGEFDKAEYLYKKSLQLEPNEGWGYYGLGEVYEKRNWPREAIFNYRNALRLGLGDPASEKTVTEKLQALQNK